MKNKKSYPSILIIIFYIAAQLLPILFIAFASPENQTDASIYGSMISFALGAVLMIYVNKKYRFYTSLEERPSSPLRSIISWGILGMFLAVLAQNVAGYIEIQYLNQTIDSTNTQFLVEVVQHYPLFLILTSIAGPVMEEFVFRKVLFGVLFDRIGGIGAAVVSSLIFAFIHFDAHILLYSSMGFVFCYLYYKTKNIWTPIIAHSLMNTLAVLANIALQNLPS